MLVSPFETLSSRNQSCLTNFKCWWEISCHLEIPVSFCFFFSSFFGFPRLPFLLVFPFQVVGNGPRRIWITFFGAKSWYKKMASHGSLQTAWSVSPTNNTSTGHFPLRFRGLKEKVVSSAFPWRTWSGDLENRTGWGAGPNVHRMAAHLHFSALNSISQSLDIFNNLQWASGLREACWNHIPFWESLVYSPALCQALLFLFQRSSIRNWTANSFSAFQWTSRLLKPVAFQCIPKSTSAFH